MRLPIALHLAALLPPALSLPPSTLAVIARTDFDYIIVGGGPSGLTLANRLSADPRKQVLVLEAGQSRLGDPLIDVPGFLGSTVGNASYDWLFRTVPQAHANGNRFVMDRGKVLGGSTAINFMAWGRPAKGEIDGARPGEEGLCCPSEDSDGAEVVSRYALVVE
ncbi:putative choline dehydrogenase [Mycena indigotica]|uniref:Putative choline dehydrogenase n=1 Tax=Mycena indigotica TaxID=2126181 RepID=A0A8H6SQS3_9AGAR|nr:putative choline dehydrogenase [Mycena indigotica]KAF7303488.1 putative choline dehydrogenase [Mycena indigotica]